MGRTMRTMSTQTMMALPGRVHNKDPSPLSKSTTPILSASNLAQSREADDSSMFPLSDPELEAHAARACQSMKLAPEYMLSLSIC